MVDAHLHDRRRDAIRAVRALTRAGRAADALEWAGRALAAWPDDPDLLAECALALLEAQRPDDAVAMASRAVASAPDHARAHAALGEVHRLGTGRSQLAVEAFNRAIALDPANPEFFVGRAAAVLDLVGERPRPADRRRIAPFLRSAVADVEHALALHPQMALAHVVHAKALLIEGRPLAAREAAARALAIDPTSALAHRIHGVALEGLGDVRAASASLASAVRLDPRSDVPVAVVASMRPSGARFLAIAFGVAFVGFHAASAFGAGMGLVAPLAIVTLGLGGVSTVRRRRFRRRLDPAARASLAHLDRERAVVRLGGLPGLTTGRQRCP